MPPAEPPAVVPAPAASAVILNFVVLSIALSVSHAAVSAVVALAASSLGESTGATSTGTLYASWVISSFCSPACMLRCGCSPRTALLFGLVCNLLYVGANLAVLQFPDAPSSLVWAASIGGAVVGGLGNGPLFVGQGLYFAHSTTRLAAARGAAAEPSDEQSDEVSPRAFLSGFFVTVYAEIAVELYAIVSRRA